MSILPPLNQGNKVYVPSLIQKYVKKEGEIVYTDVFEDIEQNLQKLEEKTPETNPIDTNVLANT